MQPVAVLLFAGLLLFVSGTVEGFAGGMGYVAHHFEVLLVVDREEAVGAGKGFFQLIGKAIVVEAFQHAITEHRFQIMCVGKILGREFFTAIDHAEVVGLDDAALNHDDQTRPKQLPRHRNRRN